MLLSLDISIRSTGYVIFNSNENIEAFGIIQTSTGEIFNRVATIEKHLHYLIGKYKITHTVVEAPAYGGRGNMSYQLFGTHFSIVRFLYTNNLSPKHLNIASIKKFATGNGRASKQQMVNALPVHIKDMFIGHGFLKSKGLYDLTDAYFIGKKYLKE